MPESKCTMCGKRFSGNDNFLKEQELNHHRTYLVSQENTDIGVVTSHLCRCFYVYGDDDKDSIIMMRTYGHGQLVEEENFY